MFKAVLSLVLYATRILFTYQNVDEKRKENSLESETLPFEQFSLPENEAIFLLLWSLWRHTNSGKNVNHLQFASCDWIIQQKAHYKPWVTENSPANKQKIRNMTASHELGKSREFGHSLFESRQLKFIGWFIDSLNFRATSFSLTRDKTTLAAQLSDEIITFDCKSTTSRLSCRKSRILQTMKACLDDASVS